MTHTEIYNTLEQLAASQLGWQTPLPRGDLTEQFDSMALLQLVVLIEDHFQICFDADDDASIKTLDDVIHIISSKLATPTTPS